MDSVEAIRNGAAAENSIRDSYEKAAIVVAVQDTAVKRAGREGEIGYLKRLLELLRALLRWLKRRKLPTPGRMVVRLIREEQMALRYEAVLPVMPTGTDIARQSLSVSHSGTSDVQSLAVDATTAQFVVPQDVDVTLSLTYIDDAGNVSAPSEQTFHSNDTIPPDAPGPFGEIRMIGEE